MLTSIQTSVLVVEQLMGAVKTVLLLVISFTAFVAQPALSFPILVANKCWTQHQQCCYEEVRCGWRCREGAGFKHCWVKYCSTMVCTNVNPRTRKPMKPEDTIEWTSPVVTDCSERPDECGEFPSGVDYEISMDELPIPSAEAGVEGM